MQGEQAEDAGDAERRVRELEGDERADGLGENHAEGDGDGEFEIAVERKQDHEDQQESPAGR